MRVHLENDTFNQFVESLKDISNLKEFGGIDGLPQRIKTFQYRNRKLLRNKNTQVVFPIIWIYCKRAVKKCEDCQEVNKTLGEVPQHLNFTEVL